MCIRDRNLAVHPQNVALGYHVGKISASCLVSTQNAHILLYKRCTGFNKWDRWRKSLQATTVYVKRQYSSGVLETFGNTMPINLITTDWRLLKHASFLRLPARHHAPCIDISLNRVLHKYIEKLLGCSLAHKFWRGRDPCAGNRAKLVYAQTRAPLAHKRFYSPQGMKKARTGWETVNEMPAFWPHLTSFCSKLQNRQ